jgi:uncharacterized protein YbjT (DUF2867 family)
MGITEPSGDAFDVSLSDVQEPPAVRMNNELGGLLTWKLAGEDAIRDSGLPYSIVRPVALTEGPAGAPLEIGQGDTMKGTISRQETLELSLALALTNVGPSLHIRRDQSGIVIWIAPEGRDRAPSGC